MKPSVVKAFLVATVHAASATARVSYRGTQVLRVPVRPDNVDTLSRAIADLGLGTWQDARTVGRFADLVVPPEAQQELVARLGPDAADNAVVMHADLEAAIAQETRYDAYAAGAPNATWFQSFHPYADHMQFLEDVQARHPDHTQLVSSGRSLDGRNLTGLRVFGSGDGRAQRPAVVFHGTVHAREWIATMVVEYIAFTFAEAAGAGAGVGAGANARSEAETAQDLAALLETYDVYAFPIVNPDGFVYTQTTDRLWRKNRQDNANSTHASLSPSSNDAARSTAPCIGRDINRNWPMAWSVDGGASADPCAQDYRGGAQADAPETAALSSWLRATHAAQSIRLYMDYHAYGQLLMTPYGYSCERQPANASVLADLAAGASDAIYGVHGVYFQTGGICSMLYKSTGNSVDYVHDVVGVPYSFTSELRDMGQTGFVLPPAQIQPSCEEAFAGVVYLLKHI
ncbi:hypothetical protein SPBR_02817 [Sporothrix brasiliensis 5110]|uniref:Peptidase M14 domain-containing protein n=1 Tax=Sporothrix brasiliensis 5110 TaxID=1398154 RepID=A0A0C2J087_9PEZI|nr:uncharacterized protein SPBR_02817 [Sporothrix brasiliensis 5110]KIH92410.1 hypothetical protein SPBR_02817 [Sporothrix brasiliensis 5110]